MNHPWMDKQTVLGILSGAGASALKGACRPLLATVSGVATTKAALIAYAERYMPAFSIITTKSFQVIPNPGNREPIICEMENGSFGNSVGLRNAGMENALSELRQLRAKGLRTLLNVSISASCAEDFVTLARAFQEVADILELNFSCPHASAGYGSAIGCDPAVTAMYVKAIKEALPDCPALIFPKLTPNVPDIATIATAAMEAGADGIAAINTVGPVVHIEPHSGKPILQNRLGGKGGKSGTWIKEEALQAVKRIRSAVGEHVPIIGMGGISSGTDLVKMLEAGADVVGIGSAFGKVHQQHWGAYGEAVLADAMAVIEGKTDPAQAQQYYGDTAAMNYEKHVVRGIEMRDHDTGIVTLDGKRPFEAGQFVFLWIPGVGEKPFSIALADPLTFVIKRRGSFTDALLNLATGQNIYLRGLYGAAVQTAQTDRALLIAGGTGIAVLPALAQRLTAEGTAVTSFVGTSSETPQERQSAIERTLASLGPLHLIADEGVVGRVLQSVPLALAPVEHTAVYIVGPQRFMAKAAHMARNAGIAAERILLSMELSTMCGIGMCGECVCGDRLTCQWGTFIPYDYLEREAPDLL